MKGCTLHVNGTGEGLLFDRGRTVFFEVHDNFAYRGKDFFAEVRRSFASKKQFCLGEKTVFAECLS